MRIFAVLGCLTAAALGGCAALPAAGPSAKEIVAQQVENHRRQFDLVNIDERVLRTLLRQPQPGFYERFKGYGKPPPPRLGVGDAVSVTIWEAAAGGLFATPASLQEPSTGAQSVKIPTQTVGPDGRITIPYAGRIPVAGLLPAEVQREIIERLRGKAIEPQAVVIVKQRASYTATVDGEVVHGARLPLSPGGERLLDLIAAAGGASAPVYDTFVELSRAGVTVTIPMARLVSDPEENIYAWPGDVLTLVRTPQSFTAFGATDRNSEIKFGAERLTLIDALAKVGGLLDHRSDAGGVFLFRYEPASVVRALHTSDLATGPRGSSPVVFRLDMGQADSYFLAERFPVENHDILYVANAPLDAVQKFFSLLNTLTGPVISGIVVNKAVP